MTPEDPLPDPAGPALVWSAEGPRSARFGDVYFSAQDGLAETRLVFLQGCGLPDAWAGRSRFTVGELGFGTGLNIVALLELWRAARPPGGRLQIFSVEGFPIAREDAARALDRWPELASVAPLLLSRWPSRAPGFHRIDLPELNACLDLAVGPVEDMLATWSGQADAWFLDGFAPAANPDMWTDAVLAAVAARATPEARIATFTVAGAVRRGLAAHGFLVEKRAGFGRKRERLEARRTGSAPSRVSREAEAVSSPTAPSSVTILGAGIAGAALARALTALGLTPTVIEAEVAGAGASGNAAALVAPRFDAGGGAVARLSAQAFERAVQLYGALPDAVLARGLLQLEGQARDRDRFDRIAAQSLWDPGAVTRLDPAQSAERLGEPCESGGLWVAEGLAVEPAVVLSAWLDGTPLIRAEIARIASSAGGWAAFDCDGQCVHQARVLVLAAGFGAAALAEGLTLTPVRGQTTVAQGLEAAPAAWGGYVVPTRRGLLFGATHDKGEATSEARPEDDRRNLAALARVRPALAERLAGSALTGRAGVRATTPDRLPLCGEIAPGLYVLGGLGSRGFTFAPLLGEHLAAMITGAASPLPGDLAATLSPVRFAARA